jgi:hypothetical protein
MITKKRSQARVWIGLICRKGLWIYLFPDRFRLQSSSVPSVVNCDLFVDICGHWPTLPSSAQRLLLRSTSRCRFFGNECSALRTVQPEPFLRRPNGRWCRLTESLAQILHGLSVACRVPWNEVRFTAVAAKYGLPGHTSKYQVAFLSRLPFGVHSSTFCHRTRGVSSACMKAFITT